MIAIDIQPSMCKHIANTNPIEKYILFYMEV